MVGLTLGWPSPPICIIVAVHGRIYRGGGARGGGSYFQEDLIRFDIKIPDK